VRETAGCRILKWETKYAREQVDEMPEVRTEGAPNEVRVRLADRLDKFLQSQP